MSSLALLPSETLGGGFTSSLDFRFFVGGDSKSGGVYSSASSRVRVPATKAAIDFPTRRSCNTIAGSKEEREMSNRFLTEVDWSILSAPSSLQFQISIAATGLVGREDNTHDIRGGG
jgi:hypothetical protein